MSEAVSALRLPFHFDTHRLRADLAGIPDGAWRPHYNDRDFGGEWRGAALRSATGSASDLTADPSAGAAFTGTALLAACPYFQEILSVFECTLKSVRLLSLAPGSFIREHSDNALDFEDGEVRLHIPIQTNPGVEFFVRGERLIMDEGDCYYVNVNMPHRVNNRGSRDRIHLVIDAEVNPWLRSVFERSRPVAPSAMPSHGMDEFRRLIVADQQLQAIADRRDFIPAVVRAGLDRGFSFNDSDVDAAFRNVSKLPRLTHEGWIPARLELRDGVPVCEWIRAPEGSFTEPFFEDSIRKLLRQPLTAFTRFEGPLPEAQGPPPAGLIFHMSRCGSTLISRCLATLSRMKIIAEAPPIDDILRSGASEANRADWLRRLAGAYGPGCVVKFDSWHIHDLPLIHRAFPETPWIFVHRDPVEVLVSQLRQPGLQMMERSGLSGPDAGVRVLRGFLTAAVAARDIPHGLLVNYQELPGAIGGRIAAHFGIRLTEQEEAGIREAAQLDAKNPYASFVPDSVGKQEAGRALRKTPAIQELEALYALM